MVCVAMVVMMVMSVVVVVAVLIVFGRHRRHRGRLLVPERPDLPAPSAQPTRRRRVRRPVRVGPTTAGRAARRVGRITVISGAAAATGTAAATAARPKAHRRPTLNFY